MLTWDHRMLKLQELGDVFLYMEAPFDWRVFHKGVLLVDPEGEDDLVPQGQGTNPYAAVDDHFRQLTQGSPLVQAVGDDIRVVQWVQRNWTDVREAKTSS